jgi:hypothetical protein
VNGERKNGYQLLIANELSSHESPVTLHQSRRTSHAAASVNGIGI